MSKSPIVRQDLARAGFAQRASAEPSASRPLDFIEFIRDMTNTWPNKSPEPTAVGPFSSAFAVHIASRRWLSFLR